MFGVLNILKRILQISYIHNLLAIMLLLPNNKYFPGNL